MQDKLSAHQICRYLLSKYEKPERLAEMGRKMLALATPDAAARVADLVEQKARKQLRTLSPA